MLNNLDFTDILFACSDIIFGGLDVAVVNNTIQILMRLVVKMIVVIFTFTQPEIGGFGIKKYVEKLIECHSNNKLNIKAATLTP